MKLGTKQNGTRDGQLMVVSRDLKRCVEAGAQTPTLQSALDSWTGSAQALQKLSDRLNGEPGFGSDTSQVTWKAPLPRAYEWIDASSYIHHILLVRKARNAEPPKTLRTDPLIYQGGSGILLGPKDDILLTDTSWGCDFESEVAVILGDTPEGVKAEDAHKYVRLLCLVNDVSLRNLIPAELEKGFGFFQSKPASGFSPFAVTPDELGDAWQGGRIHLPLETKLNGSIFGNPDAGPEMHFSFFELIAHIAKTRSYTAGTILGSGTVSNEDRSRGSSCLAERRMIEQIDHGKMETPFLSYGDTIRIEMRDAAGKNIFGTIEQKVVPAKA
ncbi:MAG: fumarylacetoacetate hydrolase family protein [Chitinophagaceae bacterium]|nr:fumarylacetoacetate hydrolase family protein [Oligoflexus sp.]